MVKGIDIQQGMIEMLVPELQKPDVLADSHRLVREHNPLLHFLHVAMMAGVESSTNFADDAIEAINLGAESYEGFSIGKTDEIPISFCLAIISKRDSDSNFAMLLAEQMAEAREELLVNSPKLALGIYSVAVAHNKRPELASSYSVGGAALIHAAHSKVQEFWQLEKEIWPDDIVS